MAYTSVPSALSGPARRWTPLCLTAVDHELVVGTGRPTPEDQEYFADLLRSYGMRSLVTGASPPSASFADLVTSALPAIDRHSGRVDLAVLCGTTPDSRPGFPMCNLSDALAYPLMAFAVLDQGVVTPFTALHVVASMVATGAASRAVLIVVDQALRQHDGHVPEWMRARHNSVATLTLEPADGATAIFTATSHGVLPADAPMLVERQMKENAAGWDTVILGHGLARLPGSPQEARGVVTAAPGLPCTGVWAALHRRLGESAAAGQRIFVADYDEVHRRLSSCTIQAPTTEAAC